MTDRPRRLLEGLGLDLARRIDALCRRFEVELAGGAAASHRRLPGRSRRRRAGGAARELEALEHEPAPGGRDDGADGARPDRRGLHHRADKARCPSRPGGSPRNLRVGPTTPKQVGPRLLRSIRPKRARATPVFQTGPSDAADTLKPGPSASPGRRETHALAFTNASGGEGPPAVAPGPSPVGVFALRSINPGSSCPPRLDPGPRLPSCRSARRPA